MNCGFYGRYITVFIGYTQINMTWIYCNLTYYNLNIENYVLYEVCKFTNDEF